MIKEGVIIGGRYEIMERIGVGGMADVYKAVDRVLRRYVAVKVLKREFREDENFVKKFRSEAQAAAGLTHPNIVNVYDVAEDRGLYYIVMELVEGITLKDYIQKKGKLTPKEVINITLQVCSGIDSAHSNNIVHRDIKPQNIMISREGKVKVTDFGIAKATSSNTISTNAMGSVHYTSPEQARGGFSDAKSDIYSLGITMYEMVTGQLPFDGDTTVSIALKHLQEDMVPPSEFVPDIPYSLEQIILKCTQKSPDRRYSDVAMLIRDLKRSIQDPEGDFVRISPLVSVADTVMITPEEMQRIHGASDYNSDYEDEDEDYYEDERRRRRQAGGKKSDIDPKMTKVVKILTIIAAVIFVGVMVWLLGSVIWQLNDGGNVETTENERNVVPDLVGMTEEQAIKACEEVGITLYVKDRDQLSVDYDAGYVFQQLTEAGTKMPEGARVSVYVSAGLKEIEVPDVSGMTEKNAKKELTDYGFKEKNISVKKEESRSVKSGTVIRTDPKAGEMGTSKTKITVYISTGAGKTKMPNLVGKTLADAQKLMDAADLEMALEEIEMEDTSQIGKVLEQGKESGEELDKGTRVKVVVGVKVKIQIPPREELVGKTYAEVLSILNKLGIVNVTKIEMDNAEHEAGIVIDVDIAGQKVEVGTAAKITVSKGSGSGTGSSGTGN